MNAEGLKAILKLMPKVFYDEQMLKNALRRMYKDNKRAQNVLYIVIESGIIDNALLLGKIDRSVYEGYIKTLYNDYGIEKIIGKQYIEWWFKALNISFENYQFEKDEDARTGNPEKNESYTTTMTIEKVFARLSQNEKMAAACIITELEDSEGVVIASQLADRYNVGRSTIVNALNKLELAGILESWSLGSKGTKVRIKNADVIDYMDEYKHNMVEINKFMNS